jgi:hypothetical protein
LLPNWADSLTGVNEAAARSVTEIQHPAGVWNPREPVFESAVFAEYHDMTLSLLVFPPHGPSRDSREIEERELMDTFEAFQQ